MKKCEGIVSGMNDYGIFVELTENKCEGMIRLREIEDDYYYFDSKNFCVVRTKRGKKYNLGDKFKVVVGKTDLIKKQLDFKIA